METINKNILLIELDDKYLKITAGFQDDEFNFKIIATEVISTNNFENGQIKDLERSVIDLKSGLEIIEKKLNTIFTEAYVITNQKNFDCINVSGFKKMNGNQILEDDISFILNDLKAKINSSEKDKTIIHLFNTKFVLDNNVIKNLPIGLYGNFYSHQLTFFLIKNDYIKIIKKLLNKSNLNLKRIILKSFSDGTSLVDNSNSGSFIKIYMGRKNSHLISFYNSAYSYFQNFNFGTDLIYSDVAKVCSLETDEVKKFFQNICFDNIKNKKNLYIDEKFFKNDFKKISFEFVEKVISSRINELISIIFNKNIHLKNLENKDLQIYLNLEDTNIKLSLGLTFQNYFKNKINFMNFDKQKNSTQVSGELLTKGWPNEAIPVVQKKTSVISRFFSIFFD